MNASTIGSEVLERTDQVVSSTPLPPLFSVPGALPLLTPKKTYSWARIAPFAFLHLGCLGVLWAGVSPVAVGVAVALYWIRMFAITGFYHRYFAHRSFETSRFWQAVFAIVGLSAVQKGPLWWAAHHRQHHRFSDQPQDVHSPIQSGFLYSHIGWIWCDDNMPTKDIKDFMKYPELVFLNRHDVLVPMVLFLGLYALGAVLEATAPGLHTTGFQMVVWGFFISTVVLFHGTVTINSLGHLWGNQRFKTDDDSRNNGWLAIVTMGEGWHNNHHFYPGSARQGFYWWEWDATYYVLKVLSWMKVVKNLHPVPDWVFARQAVEAKT